MIVNGRYLYQRHHPPIKGMVQSKLKTHGTSYGLSEAGYDIRLKQDITFLPESKHQPSRIWVQEPPFKGGPIKTGRFILASAIEEFDMPNDLIAVVHDKSTWARQGVSVFNTVIEPGWKGFLTLEIVFHGQEKVHIPAGSGIAQVLFHKLSIESQYDGKYQNQEDRPVPSKLE